MPLTVTTTRPNVADDYGRVLMATPALDHN